ncbi:ATP synthase gamma chain [Alphaproteobacteria bacterium]|nr:ATP synthase gamma chain [Alphaproteobacteria bacterium]
MSNLKALSVRIRSVKSTKKITSAMKMIAAARFKRAHAAYLGVEEYVATVEMVARGTAAVCREREIAMPPSVLGRADKDIKTVALVVLTSDRGLCGGFNSATVRAARARLAEIRAAGQTARIICIGNKGAEAMRRIAPDFALPADENAAAWPSGLPPFRRADRLAMELRDAFLAGQIDRAELLFNHFKSTMAQEPTVQPLIPLLPLDFAATALDTDDARADFDYEPDALRLMERVLPAAQAARIYRAVLSSAAAEHGARMTSMDAATRNAENMIAALTLRYNRTRQAIITTELTEIISGSEALK